MAAYRGKVAAIMAASPGGLGGALTMFDGDGNITDEKAKKGLKSLGKLLIETRSKLKVEIGLGKLKTRPYKAKRLPLSYKSASI
jgi:hypothetical protein